MSLGLLFRVVRGSVPSSSLAGVAAEVRTSLLGVGLKSWLETLLFDVLGGVWK